MNETGSERCKHFDFRQTNVQHLSIEVPDRKFSALLGANGSGKTTLLRSIYRTQKMDSGIVRLDDEDITHFSGKSWRGTWR